MSSETLSVTSIAFSNGEHIPVEYTGYGIDQSPPVALEGIQLESTNVGNYYE